MGIIKPHIQWSTWFPDKPGHKVGILPAEFTYHGIYPQHEDVRKSYACNYIPSEQRYLNGDGIEASLVKLDNLRAEKNLNTTQQDLEIAS